MDSMGVPIDDTLLLQLYSRCRARERRRERQLAASEGGALPAVTEAVGSSAAATASLDRSAGDSDASGEDGEGAEGTRTSVRQAISSIGQFAVGTLVAIWEDPMLTLIALAL
eukprot:GHVT01038817.1.p1 GENE.GHVT01038817.1~~GHVT01038817.1.p1  ORF type:complete len:112 (+),score=16.83 GHVT01038817.1:348-683(+)